jgi:hypothetical protein
MRLEADSPDEQAWRAEIPSRLGGAAPEARSKAAAADEASGVVQVLSTNESAPAIRTVVRKGSATWSSTGLAVVTQPAGASVTINGVGYGRTPIRIKYLPAGPKRIRVTKDGFESEERDVGLPIELPAATMRIILRQTPTDARSGNQAPELESQGSTSWRLR